MSKVVDPTAIEWVAENGNGKGEPLSEEEYSKVKSLFELIQPEYEDKLKAINSTMRVDYELCRKFLVARQWNLKKAKEQIEKMLNWRIEDTKNFVRLQDSPIAAKSPYAVNLRCCGFDKIGRPCMYTGFSQAHDRHHTSLAVIHMRACMEECIDVIRERRYKGLNLTADQQQWIWVIDCGGMSLRDQNPRLAILVVQMMQNYPEMLSMIVVVNPPWLFSGIWKGIQPVLDERVKQKVVFATTNKMGSQIVDRVGEELSNWLVNEVIDNINAVKDKRMKAYWLPPDPTITTHDPRGLQSYLDSEFYVPTPGDKHLRMEAEKKQ